MIRKLFRLFKKLNKCKHEYEVINPEEVQEGYREIKKCKKCGAWLS